MRPHDKARHLAAKIRAVRDQLASNGDRQALADCQVLLDDIARLSGSQRSYPAGKTQRRTQQPPQQHR